MSWKIEKLGIAITHRKEFITIDNSVDYKRCRVQVNRKGVVLRDIVKGVAINTKKQQVCKEGDFLVAEIDAKVGGYGFVGKDLEGAIVSSHYFLFELDERKLLKDYLAWLIKTDIIQDQILSKGSTNYAAIRPHHVLNFEIPFPSISQQAIIVIRLNNINAVYSLTIKELDQQQTYLQLLRQTILQEAVQGKLSKQDPTDEPATELLKRIKAEKEKLIKEGKLKKEKELPPIKEDEIPFELPKGWVWSRLGEITNYGISSKVETRNLPEDSWLLELEDIEPISSKIIRKIRFKERKSLSTKNLFKKGDVLYSKLRPYLDKVIVADEDGACSSEILPLQCFKGIEAHYLRLRLKSQDFVNYANSKVYGMNLPRLGSEDGRKSLFPLPPLPEQHRIVAKVQQLQQQLNQVEVQVQQSRDYAKQLLQTVLKEAFEPKSKVNTIEKEEIGTMTE